VQGALGFVLFTPEAVADLEQAVSGTELVRFVGTPYEIVRSYWQNMAEVRHAAEGLLACLNELEQATRWLRRLHVMALMGQKLNSFYCPASRITSRGVRPGALYAAESERIETAERTLLVSGPRVGVNPIGGENYNALVCSGDPEALGKPRTLRDADGLDWGSLVYGRASDEVEDKAWFCPPRPLLPAHFQKLFMALSLAKQHAEADSAPDDVQDLARFHYRFVRLHPFRAANQSLCMNLVNLLLNQQRGCGIPHLLLDQFALRLSEAAYVSVFARAVAAHTVAGSSSERWAQLRARKARVYALIEQLKAAPGLDLARRLSERDPEAAAAALIGR
jgi:hypothetical protein